MYNVRKKNIEMIPAMANYLDFLPALDRYVRDRPDGCVRGGYEMLEIARDAGLVADHGQADWR